jgi:Phospholipase_D-nuclease N-terminal
MILFSNMRTLMLMSSLLLAIQLSTSLLLILLPLVVIELGLVVFSLVDLLKPERRVIGDNKLVWALVIVVVGTIGPIVYLLAGRKQN